MSMLTGVTAALWAALAPKDALARLRRDGLALHRSAISAEVDAITLLSEFETAVCGWDVGSRRQRRDVAILAGVAMRCARDARIALAGIQRADTPTDARNALCASLDTFNKLDSAMVALYDAVSAVAVE